MTKKELSDIMEEASTKEMDFIGVCHVCGKSVSVSVSVLDDGRFSVEGGALYKIPGNGNIKAKCDECFKKDHDLRGYKRCEVFSRVVGYLRPVNGWNPGKQAEFGMRKTFDAAIETHKKLEPIIYEGDPNEIYINDLHQPDNRRTVSA